MAKSTTSTALTTQQYILFIGGLLAGILISITLVQNDSSPTSLLSIFPWSVSAVTSKFQSTTQEPSSLQQPTPVSSATATTDNEDSADGTASSILGSMFERFSAADTASWMKPILPATFTTSSPTVGDTTTASSAATTIIPKWTPGQANEADSLQLDGGEEAVAGDARDRKSVV